MTVRSKSTKHVKVLPFFMRRSGKGHMNHAHKRVTVTVNMSHPQHGKYEVFDTQRNRCDRYIRKQTKIMPAFRSCLGGIGSTFAHKRKQVNAKS